MRSSDFKPALRLAAVAALAFVLVAPQVLAQVPNATLRGHAEDESGGALPGVTVTVTSPQMQGARVAVTDTNGNYRISGLPPGDYRVTYALEGFSTLSKDIKLSAAQDTVDEAVLGLAAVAETIVVTGSGANISQTSTSASTFENDEVDKLAISRDPSDFVNLAPGVHDTGPSTAPSINGSMTFENLFMINGVEVSDNIRGTPLPLFIEDAIQETTVATSGVSAEYGRFTGGVINVITKSGGNEFSGSLRDNLTNDDWVNDTPLSTGEAVDDINQEFEATLGGYVLRDRLWFFGSARDREEEGTNQTTTPTSIPYTTADEEQRYEGKLTLAITPNHNLVGSMLDYDRTRANSTFGAVLDERSLTNRTDPQEYIVGNYNGVLSQNFFVEAMYAERDFIIAKGAGGVPDLIEGTMIRHRPDSKRFWAPTFCGSCEDEIRNAENALVKGSYFLSTEGLGSHDVTFGYDTFSDIRFSVNHQTGSDFQVWAESMVVGNDNTIYPVFRGANTWLVWWPPVGLDIAQPTDFETNSLYVNDAWQLNDRLSFNLGVRYDENDGKDSSGAVVTDDSKISPRLGLSWDIRGTGDLVAHASYGTYVAKIANTGNVADAASTGGALSGYGFNYAGPPVNTNCQPNGTNCVTSDVALQILFDWYLANGGSTDVNNIGDLSNLPLIFACIPGASAIVPEPYKSPAVNEVSLGAVKRLGQRGLARADVVWREYEDFYSNRVTLDTGHWSTPSAEGDIAHLGNFGDSVLEREYLALNLQGRYRFTDRLTVAGNYTLSELEGNINGETGGSGPVASSPFDHPEYHDPAWAFPVGRLNADQTHRLRAWAIFDILETDRHVLNVSLLQNFLSGSPYGALGGVDTRPVVGDIGYLDPPDLVGYWFTDRDAFETDDVTHTDVALNYAFDLGLFGRDFELFIQPEVLNVFDEDSVINLNFVDTTVLDDTNAGGFQTFNPFTQTPVEGVHWAKGPNFGEPVNENAFQRPRTFRVSVGFRF